MSKKRVVAIIINSILIVLNLIFIWGNSCMSTESSSQSSNGVYETIKPVLDATLGEGVVTHSVFRKTAHFIEFCCFGFLVSLLFALIYGIKVKKLVEIFFIGLLVAVIDESLQILSKRGADVADVLLDYCGYIFGVGILFLSVLIYKKLFKQFKK
ncbi:MAG: VanZ family protein [Clostridiales bacterium]|nr:VanZ family protein [Clostridiales bacterium]